MRVARPSMKSGSKCGALASSPRTVDQRSLKTCAQVGHFTVVHAAELQSDLALRRPMRRDGNHGIGITQPLRHRCSVDTCDIRIDRQPEPLEASAQRVGFTDRSAPPANRPELRPALPPCAVAQPASRPALTACALAALPAHRPVPPRWVSWRAQCRRAGHRPPPRAQPARAGLQFGHDPMALQNVSRSVHHGSIAARHAIRRGRAPGIDDTAKGP